MKYVIMDGTDLRVSGLCLGTVNYGSSVSKEEAFRQMDLFYQRGGNFIDTAHVYGDWVPGTKGLSEKVVGCWIKERGLENQVIVSTKGAHPDLASMNVSRVTRKEILKDLDESLKFMGLDRIDLYFLHRDNEALPAEEILAVLEEARKEGKIRYYGCSNWKLDRIKESVEAAERNGFSGFACNQLYWCLPDINFYGLGDKTMVPMDQETYDYQKEHHISAMAYSSLAQGYLAKVLEGKSLAPQLQASYENPSTARIVEAVRKLNSLGITPTQASIAFLLGQELTSVPIAAFRSCAQMEEALEGADMKLDQGTQQALNDLKKYVYWEKEETL